MGFAAPKLELVDLEDEVSRVVHLTPANTDLPFAAGDTKIDLQRLLGVISKVASILATHRERANMLEKRCQTAEALVRDSNQRVSDLEVRLQVALDDGAAERARVAEAQKRSNDIVERSRAMLSEASERIRAAETRASNAEAHFATVGDALERQFAREIA